MSTLIAMLIVLAVVVVFAILLFVQSTREHNVIINAFRAHWTGNDGRMLTEGSDDYGLSCPHGKDPDGCMWCADSEDDR